MWVTTQMRIKVLLSSIFLLLSISIMVHRHTYRRIKVLMFIFYIFSFLLGQWLVRHHISVYRSIRRWRCDKSTGMLGTFFSICPSFAVNKHCYHTHFLHSGTLVFIVGSQDCYIKISSRQGVVTRLLNTQRSMKALVFNSWIQMHVCQ